MRFGKTNQERAQMRVKEIVARQKLKIPHPYFCWLPVKLDSGEWAWLETVQRYGWLYYTPSGHKLAFSYCDNQKKKG